MLKCHNIIIYITCLWQINYLEFELNLNLNKIFIYKVKLSNSFGCFERFSWKILVFLLVESDLW